MAKRSRKQKAILDSKQRKRQHLDEGLSADWHAFSGEEDVDLESVPRFFKEDEAKEGLPVIVDGKIRRVYREEAHDSEEEESNKSESEPEETAFDGFEEEEKMPEKEEEPEMPLSQVQELIAQYAEAISENPEENIGKIRELQRMAAKSHKARTRQVIILSLLRIYKDIIPGYRIRPLSDEQMKEKATKETRQLREFEQLLLTLYKAYVDLVYLFFKQGKAEAHGKKYALATTSVAVACNLLQSAPYFNFRAEWIRLIVEKMASQRVDKGFTDSIQCIGEVFEEDNEGHVSFEIVQALAKMIKQRRYKVDSRVLGTLIHLRLLTELVGRADLERMIKEKPKDVIKKKDRIHLTRKQRKARKEQKEIDEEMRKAETAVSAVMREKMQAQTLKLVFVLYFNILKERSRTLMPATLEGLAKFAHLINADLFGDLLEVLREILSEQTEDEQQNTRQTLLCVCTAFALLSGQVGDSINLDLSFFINRLYNVLYPMALSPGIEQSHKHLESTHKGKLSSETDMLVRSLQALFSKQSMASRPRVLAFTKRLAMCALQFPERTSLVSCNVMDMMIKKHPYVKGIYTTTDRVARGVYNSEAERPEQSNAEVSTIWETAILRHHYSPKVSAAAEKLSQTHE